MTPDADVPCMRGPWPSDESVMAELQRRNTFLERSLAHAKEAFARLATKHTCYQCGGPLSLTGPVEDPSLRCESCDANVRALQGQVASARGRAANLDVELQAIRKSLSDVEQARAVAEANYQFMVNRAADQHLDGYRALGAHAAAAENARDEALSRIQELEAQVEHLSAENALLNTEILALDAQIG